MSELQNIKKKKKEQFENHVYYPLSHGAAEYYEPWVSACRGATPLNKPYKYVPPQRIWFLRLFGLKGGILTFCSFWSGIGYGFREKYGSV